MRCVPPEAYPEWNKAGLIQFLKECRRTAVTDGCATVASISMAVKHIDPLAVLESIYEPNELHFYCEHTGLDCAVAGAEAVLQKTFSGHTRFADAKAFAQSVLTRTVAIGDQSLPFSGPHFFAAFTFFDEAEQGPASFAPATVFLPRWQVARFQGHYTAVANVCVEADSNIETLAEKMWAAHEKFSAFDYATVAGASSSAPSFNLTEVGPINGFELSVAQVLEAIEAGDLQKVVLARAVDLCSEASFEPLTALNRLRETHPASYAFSIGNARGSSFVGATPERLLKIEGRQVYTEAIAGSAPRSESAREDAVFADALLKSEKDQREHQFVIDLIEQSLKAHGVELFPTPSPRLIKLPTVQHLKTPVAGSVKQDTHVLDLVDALHPTPAVGGIPADRAKHWIAELEPFDRGLYAGVLGWFNAHGSGEFVVALRSGLIQGKQARLYTGVGIVKGSVPGKEKQETDWKLATLLKPLQF